MPTTREVSDRKRERIRQEDKRKALQGPPCPVCRLPTWKPLVDATGDATHPCCSDPVLMRQDAVRLAASTRSPRASSLCPASSSR